MEKFDPAAAAAQYLSVLTAEDQAKAVAYTHMKEWLILGGWVAALIVAWLVLRTGLLARIRDGLQRKKQRPLLISFVVGVAYLLLSTLFTLPWGIFADWWLEREFGMTSQSVGGFIVDQLVVLPAELVLVGAFFVAFYALVRRAPRLWPVFTMGVVALFALVAQLASPVVIEPLLNTYQPAPPGPVLSAVKELGAKAGVPTDKVYVYNGSKQSNRYTANVSGVGSTARVAMSDVMFAKGADLAEVRGVVGHEMGHYARGHVWWLTSVIAMVALLSALAVRFGFPPAARLLGADTKGVADPAGLPVVVAIFATVSLLVTPLQNSAIQMAETDADNFSYAVANEPDGIAKALVKTAEYRAANPSAIEEMLFYDHPSVSRRVRCAMDWKAAHPRPAGVATDAAPRP